MLEDPRKQYKTLTMKQHPDCGCSTADIQAMKERGEWDKYGLFFCLLTYSMGLTYIFPYHLPYPKMIIVLCIYSGLVFYTD